MIIVICLACSFVLCPFSFWLGRCARRLPIIDDNLPWTMSREQAARCTGDCVATHMQPPEPPAWPDRRLRAAV
jgi:hypothetical protein